MTDKQENLYNTLCAMEAEDIVRAFVNWNGEQILTEEFHKFLVDEEYIWEAV